MKLFGREKHPIYKRIFIPIFCLMIVQSFVFYFATVYGGVIGTLNKNAEDILTERIINRKSDIQTQFNTRWNNMKNYESAINNIYNNMNAQTENEIYADAALQKQFLSETSDVLISMLRANGVNGVFIVLNDNKDYVPVNHGEYQEKYGLCIRDYDQNSGYNDKEDLLVDRCPSSIVQDIGCSLDTWWEAVYTFDDTANGDFFYKPLKAAYDNKNVDTDNLAYFQGNHKFSGSDKQVVSYSIPLIDENGYPYAVLGIEVTSTYLQSLLPSEELQGYKKGSYVLVQYYENANTYKVIASDGILFQRAFGREECLDVSRDKNIIELQGKDGMKICGSVSDLTIYNKNTPFENEKFALIGIVEKESLYHLSASIKKVLFMVSILLLAIGIIAIFIVSRRLANPVKKLADKVRGMDGNSKIKLERINIDEIDELVNALEELSQNINKNQVRTEFFSRMSHDMRTPMNAIIGFSSPEILDGANEETKNEYLEKIQASGIYLLGLINEVLDMTKIDSNKLELKETSINVKNIWNDVLPIIEEISKQKNINFSTNIGNEDEYIYADCQRISQIFVNLLSNAVKFAKEGGNVSLKVSVLSRDSEKVIHRIIVEDDGIGMSEEFQKKLYQPFTQEHSGIVEGTGLGLSIAKRLIELMNGTIECESELNKGTRFVVTLTNRISYERDNNNSLQNKYVSKDENCLNGKRILLCEDHPLNMQIAKNILKKVGIEVDTAENGVKGLEMFNKSNINYYSAILMDIRMPEMNGIEATKKIRKLDREDAATIPIIAMTANAFAEDIRETAAAGMNEHLSKPIEPQKLYAVLRKYLSK